MRSRQRCKQCNEYKPIVAFAIFRDRSNVQRRRGVCAECRGKYAEDNFVILQAWRRKYNATHRDQKRARDLQLRAKAKAFVDAFKSRPCADCGKRWPPVAMDLDHVRGAKVRNISALVSGSYRVELIALELEKCEVVCACCHRIRTANRNENVAPSIAIVERKRTGASGGRKSRKGTAAALEAEAASR